MDIICYECSSKYLNPERKEVNDRKFKVMEIKERYICAECKTPNTFRLNVKRKDEMERFLLLQKNSSSLLERISYIFSHFQNRMRKKGVGFEKDLILTRFRESLLKSKYTFSFLKLKKLHGKIREYFNEVLESLEPTEQQKIVTMIKQGKSFSYLR